MPAGLQPRAAVGYMLVGALEVAALCGAAPSVRSEVDVAAAHAERLAAEWGPDGPEDGLAKTLARELEGTVPLVAGAGLTGPIAYRWKCQFNENSKIHSFSHELPELDHNEVVGWESAAELGRFSAIFLEDGDSHPRVRQRFALTRDLIAPTAAGTHVLESDGQSGLDRVMSLVLLGDLVSLYLAILRGVDPTPVAVLERLKDTLGRP
jgi:glucose/mannose-6-phosphate isomerase